MKENFVHLHVHSEFSLLDGACRISDLVSTCKELGMDTIAITDHGVMYGVIDFYRTCKKAGIKPIIGCEVYTAKRSRFHKEGRNDSDYGHLVLLAKDNIGYANLIKLVSLSHTEGFYYKPRVDLDLLREYSQGLICLSACLAGDIPSLILQGEYDKAKEMALTFNEIFGQDNFFLELQSNDIHEQLEVNNELIKISKETNIPLVCTNDVHFIKKEDARVQEILMCIQTNKKITDENRFSFNTDKVYLRSPEEMHRLFSSIPQALENTIKIGKRCNVEITFDDPVLPYFEVPEGQTHDDYLRDLCYEGAKRRFDTITDKIRKRLDYELSVISSMGYSDYYLIVWDFIKYAKDSDILVGPGRGSGAGSLVAYCLRITNVDSLRYNLAFERFLNPDRVNMPDFDVDFSDKKRKLVIDYVIEKYGEDRVAQITTFGTMAAKAAIRDVGRVLDFPYDQVDRIAKLIPNTPGIKIEDALRMSKELKSIYLEDPQITDLIDTSIKLEGTARNVSTHAAGVVITKEPVTNYVPIQVNQDIVVTQYPMGNLESLGLLKVDFLGLRTLSVIDDSLEMIRNTYNIEIDFDNMEKDDPKVFKTIGDGKTVGIFQLESPGMTSFMTELKPESLEDIIAGISLYRPGPMDQIPVYIKNKQDPSKVVYQDKILENILELTYGCLVYQEQVMQIVRDMAGFSMGKSDMIRRAMSAKDHKVMEDARLDFLNGAKERGISDKLAKEVFEQLREFASYAFNKSHAAAYAIVAYETAYLKTYYPVIFMASLINNYIGSSSKVTKYIGDLKQMDIELLPPDINLSFADFTVCDNKIRFGLHAIKNVGQNALVAIINEREENGHFTSFADFVERVGCQTSKRCIESLIKAGAFDNLGIYRSRLLAVLDYAVDSCNSIRRNKIEGQVSLFDLAKDMEDITSFHIDYPNIDEFSADRLYAMEKEMVGVYITGHPLAEYEDRIKHISNIKSSDLIYDTNDEDGLDFEYSTNIKDRMKVTFVGVLSELDKKVTRNNQTMAFARVQDLYGDIEILLFPNVYDRFKQVLNMEAILVIKGYISLREEREANIIVDSLSPISSYVNENVKVLEFRVDKKQIDKLINFIEFFFGKTEINLIDKETNQSLYKGFINAEKDIMSNFEEILTSSS